MTDNAYGTQKSHTIAGIKKTTSFDGPHGGGTAYHQMQYNAGMDNGINQSFNINQHIQGHTQQSNITVPIVRKKT